MEAELVARATVAASSLGRDLELQVDDVVVVQNSNKLALRVLPCNVLARTAVAGEEVAAFEIVVTQHLGALSAPIARPDPRVEPLVYERDGFAVTFWTFYDSVTDAISSVKYADALHRLHGAMQRVEVEVPHFTERVAEAERLVMKRSETPELGAADRALLLDTLRVGVSVRPLSPAATRLKDVECSDEVVRYGEPHTGHPMVSRQRRY
ncbi:hypothetical protein [Luteipulveratus mongoliensis]|uniref:hypothetical protein n=1 Tax=Luteipulveratus mongoliensis TaxID=571913 RepID=UPI0006981D22|nr:hypothetical protein [Luteipulveratus mongoliensis]